jgi:hypothetical protein
MSKPKKTPPTAAERREQRLNRTIKRQHAVIARQEERLGTLLVDLRDSLKELDVVRRMYERRGDQVVDLCRDLRISSRQLAHVRALYEAMVQRYVGTKLDTQQFTFPQARQFLDNEWGALNAALTQIRDQVEREQTSNGCAMAPIEQEAA